MMTKKLDTPVKDEEEFPVGEAQISPTDWVKQVDVDLLDAEKKWFELAAEQNDLTLKAIRQGIELYRNAPTLPMASWSRQVVENFLEVQKKWLDNASQQRSQMLRQSQEAGGEATAKPVFEGKAANAVRLIPELARPQLESLIEARRHWLDFAEQQNTQFAQGMQEALGLKETSAATNFTNWSRQVIENYLEMQKRWLGFITPTPPAQHPDNVA